MDLPEYVTVEEVKRVCQELKISDWTEHENSKISSGEAKTILLEVNVEKMDVDRDEFRQGLEVELEHGLRFKDANVGLGSHLDGLLSKSIFNTLDELPIFC